MSFLNQIPIMDRDSLRELKKGLNYSKRSIILKEIEIIN